MLRHANIYLLLEEYLKKKNFCSYHETADKQANVLKSLGGSKGVKNMEIFWMNNKTSIEFGRRRIMLISETVIHISRKCPLDLHNSSYYNQSRSWSIILKYPHTDDRTHFLRIGLQNLIKGQSILPLVITLLIFITFSFDVVYLWTFVSRKFHLLVILWTRKIKLLNRSFLWT